jgi:hypothetical protein
MNSQTVPPRDRREFLRTGLRAAALAGLAFAGVFLGWKSSSRPDDDFTCRGARPCGECPELTRCPEPAADAARRSDRGIRP